MGSMDIAFIELGCFYSGDIFRYDLYYGNTAQAVGGERKTNISSNRTAV